MKVIKRDGTSEVFDAEKIRARIVECGAHGTDLSAVDIDAIVTTTSKGVCDGMTTEDVDKYMVSTIAGHTQIDHAYSRLAGAIAVSNIQKQAPATFSRAVGILRERRNIKGEVSSMVSDELHDIVRADPEFWNAVVRPERDYMFDHFAIATLKQSFLKKVDGVIVETPQYLYLRVAIGIHGRDKDAAVKMYNSLSQHLYTHATPTLFNSGTPFPQMSSCFLVDMKGDSIEGIFGSLKDIALISKHAGGVGVSINRIRARGSYVAGTDGKSNGTTPMLKVFNEAAKYVNQGGKRKGSICAYMQPWHRDIREFLNLRSNVADPSRRAPDLFYALWVPDLFMKRVDDDAYWTLFSPDEVPGLEDKWGDEFEAAYIQFEEAIPGASRIKAWDLYDAINTTRKQTGMPFILFADSCNAKSNHRHLGKIKSSNLCTEIIQYTAPDEIAVCNLASISLPACVTDAGFDFDKLDAITQEIVHNLNRVIDRTFYPVPEARKSNMKHRPMGIGVQGLHNAFLKLGLVFTSEAARTLNIAIFEQIYFSALTASCDLAREIGPYESYQGSPASQGILQFDMWKTKVDDHRWGGLRKKIDRWGLRNSLLVAPMPTATTSQILGNNECVEPFHSNLFMRKTLSGEFIVVNHFMVADLKAQGMWNDATRESIMQNNGSVQQIDGLPDALKEKYRTIWEIPQRHLIQMAAERGAFIDQSQSLNVFFEDPTREKLRAMDFYAWRAGLKGSYYIRSRAGADPVKMTLSPVSPVGNSITQKPEADVCTRDDPDCVACGA